MLKANTWILIGSFFVAGVAQSEAKLVITGSSTIAPLALEMAKQFEKVRKGVRVDVQAGGSSRGVTDARQSLADIGMVSRALHPEESDLKARTIALDGVAIILHKSNSVGALSPKQISAIYQGQVRRWKEVGGADQPVVVVNKAEGRSTLELFTHYLKLKNSDIKAQVVIGDNEQGIKTVAGNPYAIGYVSVGTAEFAASNGVAIKLLPLEGVAANVDNVKNGTYPLSRALNFVTKAEPQGLAKDFLEFAQSPAVAGLIKEQYFVPIETKK